MKFSIALACFVAASLGSFAGSPSAFAQGIVGGGGYHPVAPFRTQSPARPAARPASTYGSNTGWGSVANPGLGHPPNVTPSGTPKGFNNSGLGGARPYQDGNHPGKGRGNGLYGGGYYYGSPVYIPGYYDSVAANPYEAQNNGYEAGPQQERPTVVIQNFYPTPNGPQQREEESNLQTYRAPAAPPVTETPSETAVNSGNYYLIAYKDHHIYSALAYWIEGQTLHYVTTQNTHNQAALDTIDLNLTKRLNQDRSLAFTAGQ